MEQERKSQGIASLFLLFVLIVPFYLNDGFYRWVRDAQELLVIDYLSRLLPMALALYHPALREMIEQSLKLQTGIIENLVLVFVMAVGFIVVAPPIIWFADNLAGWWTFFQAPIIEPHWLWVFDITFGLVLVAISEEVVFTALFFRTLEPLIRWKSAIVMLSATVSSLAQWGSGLGSVSFAFVSGVLLMLLYLRSGSILPGIVVLYLYNLKVFW